MAFEYDDDTNDDDVEAARDAEKQREAEEAAQRYQDQLDEIRREEEANRRSR
jgi:hypothetical protein